MKYRFGKQANGKTAVYIRPVVNGQRTTVLAEIGDDTMEPSERKTAVIAATVSLAESHRRARAGGDILGGGA